MQQNIKIAMWSGPRNLSTALMRSFENRKDCSLVVDEPFYAAYLLATDKAHPMREEVIASQSGDWQQVADECAQSPYSGVIYQKHMAQHMVADLDWGWTDSLRNCFLIRDPLRVATSFLRGWPDASLEDLGFVQQAQLFEHVCQRSGQVPPVIDAEDLRAQPEHTLRSLCEALGLPWDAGMLNWPAGGRDTDGVWAAHWYHSVNASTSFASPDVLGDPPSARAQALADEARPYFEILRKHTLGGVRLS